MQNNILQRTRKTSSEFLYGASSVIAALEGNRRRIKTLFVKETSSSPSIALAISLAAKRQIPVTKTHVASLDKHSESRPHNGLVLETSPLKPERLVALGHIKYNDNQQLCYDLLYSLKESVRFEKVSPSGVWIALDKISDPQNLGSIIRTAKFFGVDAIIKTENDSCPLSPITSKSSAGAMENMDIYTVTNLPKFLEASTLNGWECVGTDINDSENRTDIDDYKIDGPTIIVLGSEGRGIRSVVSQKCSRNLFIQGGNERLDSLNVGVATGILLHKLCKNIQLK